MRRGCDAPRVVRHRRVRRLRSRYLRRSGARWRVSYGGKGGRRRLRRGRWSGVRSPRGLHLHRCIVQYSLSGSRELRIPLHAERCGGCGKSGSLVSMCDPFRLTLNLISGWYWNVPARLTARSRTKRAYIEIHSRSGTWSERNERYGSTVGTMMIVIVEMQPFPLSEAAVDRAAE